ncbi:sulfotransferase family 2 domain-containing protein [Salicola sp. Rm-C-2C1-2]|uniref:sulfotransferase family 2 domain-containing protein n=1 Tax=Salicola sp. Rm-C-2C1-2 TaxID=3141321 RepID=UPI0032E43169
MLFCETKKFVFIAVPKTGTTSIHSKLKNIDSDVAHNKIKTPQGEWINVRTHITAAEVQYILGDNANNYTFVAFIRDPREVILSKYHFYKSGRAHRQHGLFQAKPFTKDFKISIALRVLLAQSLPLKAWASLYPFKSSSFFLTDNRNELKIDKLGVFDQLQDDFTRIFSELGYSHDELALNLENKSANTSSKNDLKTVEDIVLQKVPKDLEIYTTAKSLNIYDSKT